MTEVVEGFVDLVEDAGGDHVVGKEAPHEELHGHVVDAADVLLVVDSEGFHHARDDDALDGHGGGNPPFAARGGALITGHGVFQLVDDFFLELERCDLVHDGAWTLGCIVHGARKICST